VEIHREIAKLCAEEINIAPAGKREAVTADVRNTMSKEFEGLIPGKEEFNRLVRGGGTSVRQDVQEAIKNDFVDKTLHEIIGMGAWSEKEAALRGGGWKMVSGAFELQNQERVIVAQMSRDGNKVSIVEGAVAGIEMDGGVSVSVGESIVEVDTRGAQSKIYRKSR